MNPTSSPSIQNIPEDIARLIAFYALPSRPTPSRSQSPVSLSQVSSTWRNVVLSASELWSTLYISAKSIDLDVLEICQQQAVEWLRRAEGRPLSIFFHLGVGMEIRNRPHEPNEDELLGLQKFLTSLSPFIPQARRIGFEYVYIGQLLDLLPDVHWTVENLEALDIVSEFEDDLATVIHKFPPDTLFDQVVPKLRELIVKGEFMIDSLESSLALPWSMLTKVVIADSLQHITTWVDIMQSCPQMEFGEFNLLVYEDPEQYRLPNQLHTHLETLNLTISTKLVEVISLFQFTSLRNVYLRSGLRDEEDRDAFPPASHFQNFHGLRSLYLDSIDGVDMDITLLICILREGINLEELTLIHMGKDNALLFEAMSYDQSPQIIPHLGFLRIEVMPERNSKSLELQPHWRLLYDMLVSRTLGIMPIGYRQLQKLSLSEYPTDKARAPGAYFPVAQTLAQMLFPCREAGVEIILGEDSELDWIPLHIRAFEM